MKKFVLLLAAACCSFSLFAQVVTSPVQKFPLRGVFNLSPENDVWKPALLNQQLPKPHPGADRLEVERIKQELAQQHGKKRSSSAASAQRMNATPPVMLENFIGNAFNLYVPNDNDVAVSNDGFVGSVNNTMLYGKNTATGQIFSSVTLHSLVASLGLTQEEFDPKILYDPGADRFIIAFLNGFSDSTSNIILGFSQGNTSNGLWNFYVLPGDPLGTGLWTDFPMFAVSNEELFITVNLLYNDSSWQTGFNQTIIWQLRKNDGYAGFALSTQLHSNFQVGNTVLRNLCPVKGSSGNYGPGMWFLSNRNFSAGNDSIFLVRITDTIGSAPQPVQIQTLQSPLQYRIPLDAVQLGSTEKLITNDARVMGAFLHNDQIQFVTMVFDTVSGYNGIYHGRIDQVSTNPQVDASIYTVPNTDIAYPNIAYSGLSSTDNSAIFGFLFASPTLYPGTAAAAWDGTAYSTHTVVRNGSSGCNMLIGDERWGDYTGCQTRYNEPGRVWVNGSYTIFNGVTRTWIAELSASATSAIGEQSETQQSSMVYPNPVAERCHVKFDVPEAGRVIVQVLTAEGKLLHTLFEGALVKGPNEISFEAEALAPGAYLILVSDVNGQTLLQERMVKN